jgi:hypothetical protein
MRAATTGRAGAFVVDISSGAGPRQQRSRAGFATKREAVAAMNKLQQSSTRGTYVAPSKLTLADYLEQWLPTARARLRPGATTPASCTCAPTSRRGSATSRCRRGRQRRWRRCTRTCARTDASAVGDRWQPRPSTTSTARCLVPSTTRSPTGSCSPIRAERAPPAGVARDAHVVGAAASRVPGPRGR